MPEWFRDVVLVLVRPAGPLNVGAVARAMKNTGFERLVLVEPGEVLTPEAYRMAVSSGEILDGAAVKPSLADALTGCSAAFGVTARHRRKRPRLTPDEGVGIIRSLLEAGSKVALVFGPEDRGLSADEIEHCQHLIGIPSHPELTSYNLAQAVLLICYALFTHRPPVLKEGTPPTLASIEDRQRLERVSEEFLELVGYLTPNRETHLRDLVRRLVYRTDLETRDVRHLLAIMRHVQMGWDERPTAARRAPTSGESPRRPGGSGRPRS